MSCIKEKKSAKEEILNTDFYFVRKRRCLEDSEKQKSISRKSYFHLVLLSSYFTWLLVIRKSRTTCKCKRCLISGITDNIGARNTCPCSLQEGWTSWTLKVPPNPNHSMSIRHYTRFATHFLTKEVLRTAHWEVVTFSGKMPNPRNSRRESTLYPWTVLSHSWASTLPNI